MFLQERTKDLRRDNKGEEKIQQNTASTFTPFTSGEESMGVGGKAPLPGRPSDFPSLHNYSQ